MPASARLTAVPAGRSASPARATGHRPIHRAAGAARLASYARPASARLRPPCRARFQSRHALLPAHPPNLCLIQHFPLFSLTCLFTPRRVQTNCGRGSRFSANCSTGFLIMALPLPDGHCQINSPRQDADVIGRPGSRKSWHRRTLSRCRQGRGSPKTGSETRRGLHRPVSAG